MGESAVVHGLGVVVLAGDEQAFASQVTGGEKVGHGIARQFLKIHFAIRAYLRPQAIAEEEQQDQGKTNFVPHP